MAAMVNVNPLTEALQINIAIPDRVHSVHTHDVIMLNVHIQNMYIVQCVNRINCERITFFLTFLSSGYSFPLKMMEHKERCFIQSIHAHSYTKM